MIAGVVLAGGFGRLTATNAPKVLAPIGGRPMVRRLVDDLMRSLPHVVVVTNGYTYEPIRALFASEERRIHVILQPWRCGTAGATAYALACASTFNPSHLIVVNGDMPLLSQVTLERLLDSIQSHPDFPAHVTTVEVTAMIESHVERYGRVRRMDGVGIVNITEFADADGPTRALPTRNVGLYGLRVDFLLRHLCGLREHTRNHGPAEYYLPEVLREAELDERVGEVQVANPLEALGVNSDADYDRVCQAYTQLYG